MQAILKADGVMPLRVPRHVLMALAFLGAVLLLTTRPGRVYAATFTPSTPAELISAINTANSNGQDDVIDLGGGSFTLTASNDSTEGSNGLPSVTADGGHTLTIRNGTIQRQNAAPAFRLLHVALGATVTLDTVTLSGGLADASGLGAMGGAVFSRGTVNIVNSTITNNAAAPSGNGFGGGVAVVEATAALTVTASTFNNNTAGLYGGGIQNTRGTVTLVDSAVTGNTATNGGAIENEGGTLNITASTLRSNTATGQGGGLYVGFNSLTNLVNVTLSGNTAGTFGGAVYQTFIGNLRVAHSTLSGNAAPIGGGIYNDTTLAGTVVSVRASVLDTGASGANCAGAGISSLGSNVIDDNSCGFAQAGDLNNATLNLGPLQDNGGPTQTHALITGSAAIDSVVGFCTQDGTFSGPAVSTDQRGVTRPSGSACDAGAFEVATLAAGSLQFSAATYTVSEAGPTSSVTVTRTGGSDFQVSATVTLTNSTATAPADFDSTPLTVTFAAGDTAAKTLSIPLVNDALDEADEELTLTLTSPTGSATLGAQASATLTLTDNDLPPTLSINDVTLAEGNAGSTAFAFTVTLSAASGQQITVQAQTADGSATVAAGEYAATGPTVLTFVPGDTSETFLVQVSGNTINEPDKTFFANLTSAVNATILDNQGIGTITNDDGLPVFSIANVTVTEGHKVTSPQDTRTAIFTVSRTGSTSQSTSVQYATADGTATGGVDYGPASGTLTFAPNESSKTVSVTILGDTLIEPDETFTVTLSNPTNATLGTAQAVGTIANDDLATCTPRPRVTQALSTDGSELRVHIEATPLNTQANNSLRQIRFGTMQNGTVTMNGTAVTSGQTVQIPAGTFAAEFVVRRVTPGQATTVPFTVTDGCGEWQTFVGGGAGAGF